MFFSLKEIPKENALRYVYVSTLLNKCLFSATHDLETRGLIELSAVLQLPWGHFSSIVFSLPLWSGVCFRIRDPILYFSTSSFSLLPMALKLKAFCHWNAIRTLLQHRLFSAMLTHPHALHPWHCPERAQRPQRPHRLERLDPAGAQQRRGEVD